jgi:hypothetical protein
VAALKGKTINQIIDDILFPTAIPTLIQPRISYASISKLVKVGSTVLKPSITFTQGHSGGADGDPIEIILGPDGSEFTGETYPTIGKYTYKAEQKYLEGEELVNNKGELTGIKIKAGTTTTETSTTATYPWYTSSNNKNTPEKEQDLVAFGSSPEIQFSLTGECQIWLPGGKSSIDSFKVDVGMGYLDVDLKNGWTIIVKAHNGIDYVVYSK